MYETNGAGQAHSRRRELSRRELLKLVMPGLPVLSWGGLVLERARCSACGLCVRECLTKVLTAGGDRGLVITYQSDLCDACGKCLEVCPENCLRSRPKGAAEGVSPEVLFKDEVARCRVCDAIIGSRAMIDRVRARLESKDPVLAAQLQLCPACKGK